MSAPGLQSGIVGTLLALDAVTAEVADDLERAGISVVLLKGPTISRWLYDAPSERPYDDIDILVRERELRAAEDVLRAGGFRYVHDDWHGRIWLRGPINVDLHHRILGLAAEPDRVFEVLLGSSERFELGRGSIRMPSPAARALLIALHAAQHGPDLPHPLEDLRRAIERLAEETWEEAALVATEFDARDAFATGLDLLPEGASLRGRLGFDPHPWAGVPELTMGLLRFAATPGARSKASLLVREVFPPRSYLQAHYGLARRGRAGLLATRAWRPLSFLLRLGPALSAALAVRRRDP
jgi:hypothetical protein